MKRPALLMQATTNALWKNIRGTLAYYFAALVLGPLIVSAPFLFYRPAGDETRLGSFLTSFFFGIFLGSVDALLFAFLLRRVMRLFRSQSIWAWLFSGAGLALALTTILTLIGERFRMAEAADWHTAKGLVFDTFWTWFANAPSALWNVFGLKLLLIEGAVAGVLLCLVERTFARRAKAIDHEASP
jgi:hypothetical protein